VEDFNSIIISSDSRTKGDRTNGFFCGGGSINANNAIEYATFMRFGFRSGLKGNYCIKNLGFRCAKDIKKEN
jgi:formylglycine-generating enzyme required for sulfatase activity